MSLTHWFKNLGSRTFAARRNRDSRKSRSGRPYHRRSAGIELLEDRTLLAFDIVPTFAANITSDPNGATIMNSINTVIAAYESFITDNITINLTFQEGGGLGGSSTAINTVSYSNYRAALVAQATSANDTTALASLPTASTRPVNGASFQTGTITSGSATVTGLTETRSLATGQGVTGNGIPAGTTIAAIAGPNSITLNTNATLTGNVNLTFQSNNNVWVRTALIRALGLSGGTTANDSTITLNTASMNLDRTGTQDATKFDLMAVTAHEINEAIAFGSAMGLNLQNGDNHPATASADDLFRYDQTGARSYDTNLATQAFFSIDGGATRLARFNQTAGGDYGDWFSPGGQPPQVQDAFGTPGATPNLGVELTRLDILGYTIGNLIAPTITSIANRTVAVGEENSFDFGRFTDPNAGPWTVSVSWGDGSNDATFFLDNAGELGALDHIYGTTGTYTSTVTVTDFSGQTSTRSFSVTVSGNVVVNGDKAGVTDDDIDIQRNPLDPATLEIFVNGQLDYSGPVAQISSITVLPGNGHNTIRVFDLPSGTSLSLNGGTGPDAFIIGGGDYDSRIDGSIGISSSTGIDTLTIDNKSDGSGSQTYTLENDDFDVGHFRLSTASNAPVAFTGINSVMIEGSDEDLETYNLHSVGTLGGGTLTVNGRGGSDSFHLFDSHAAVVLDGGDDADEFFIGGGNYLQNIEGTITVNGGSGADLLNIDDTDTKTGSGFTGGFPSFPYQFRDSYTLTSNTFKKSGLTTLAGVQLPEVVAPTLMFDSVADFRVQGSNRVPDGSPLTIPGPESLFNIHGVADGTTLTIHGNSGDDKFVVLGAGDGYLQETARKDLRGDYDTYIDGPLNLHGDIGDDELEIDDRRDPGDDTYILRRATVDERFGGEFTKQSGGVSNIPTLGFTNVVSVKIDGSNANNTFDLQGTRSGVAVTANGNGGADEFIVNVPRLNSNLTIRGGDPTTSRGDTLVLNGNSTATGSSNGGKLIRTRGHNITYSQLESPPTIEDFDRFTITTPRSWDSLVVSSPETEKTRISGTSTGIRRPTSVNPGGVESSFAPLDFSNVRQLTLDTKTNDLNPVVIGAYTYDPYSPDDRVAIQPDALLGICEEFVVETGPGNQNYVEEQLPATGSSERPLLKVDGAGGSTIYAFQSDDFLSAATLEYRSDGTTGFQPYDTNGNLTGRTELSAVSYHPFYTMLSRAFTGIGAEPLGTYHLAYVTNSNDRGAGSLREAISLTNEFPTEGTAVIVFAIPDADPGYEDIDSSVGGDPDADVFYIRPSTPLPPLARGGVIVNGQSQWAVTDDSNPNGPEIVLDGAGVDHYGLRVYSDNNVIHGLNVQGFGNSGVIVGGTGNTLTHNNIGTDPTGHVPIGNVNGGVLLFSTGNTIEENVIAGNDGDGVTILLSAAVGNVVRRNSIYANAGLGIDLGDDGVTANDPLDADTGPNGLQNFPVFTFAQSGETTRVAGTLNSTPKRSYTVDFYANTDLDPSGHGEGHRWLHSIVVTTGADGNVSFDRRLQAATLNTEWITATATDSVTGSTSEFSAGRLADDEAGSISGIVYADTDADGVLDDAEAGLGGWTVFLDQNANGVLDPGAAATFVSTDVPKGIPDPGKEKSELEVSGVSALIADVDVTLTIDHQWNGDLTVFLISPAGTRVELFTHIGEDDPGFENTTLDDEATRSITSGGWPYDGSYRPVGFLGDFDGEDANGMWKLEVSDSANGERGRISSWSLSVSVPEPSTQSDAEGNYQFTDLLPGPYIVREQLPGGWIPTEPATGSYEVALTSGEDAADLNFGNTRGAVVTSTADSGPGTLRAAIQWVNTLTEDESAGVAFRIPDTDPGFVDLDGDSAGDVFVITPQSALPALTHGNINVNGQSQHALTGDTNPAGPEIVLNGGAITETANGLHLDSDGNRVHGLNIQQFGGAGIVIAGDDNVLTENFIGTDPTGNEDQGNGDIGVFVIEAGGNTIEGNLVSGNDVNGVVLGGATSTNNVVRNNRIGTNATGTEVIGNTLGVHVGDAPNNLIEGNLLSGNLIGIDVSGAMAVGNVIRDNLIGTDATGTSALRNRADGVFIDNAPGNFLIDNVISGNGFNGVNVVGPNASDNTLQGNTIGADITGTARVPNQQSGVRILDASGNLIGGAEEAARNVIAGNADSGITIEGGSNNTIQGNYIGTDKDGNGPLSGVVSWYRAENDADDAVGSNDGTLQNGTTFAPGMVGQAFSFDGVDDYVTTPLVVDYTGGVTFELWVKTTDDAGALMTGGGGATANRGMGLFTEPGGVLLLEGTRETPGVNNFYIFGPSINDGTFHHIAATWTGDTTSDGVKLYLDGELIGTTTALASIGTDGEVINLGLHSIGYSPFAGLIDEPTVYDRVLSEAEIQSIFDRGSIGKTGDVGNGVDGVHIVDSSGNLIGGTTDGDRNVIAGNNNGISINGPLAYGNHVAGNYIGLGADGVTGLGNVTDGVRVVAAIDPASSLPGNLIGGTSDAERNVIAGSGQNNINLGSVGTFVQGNYIGTDWTGQNLPAGVARGRVGIRVGDDLNTLIGGAQMGAGNVIAGHSWGIYLSGRYAPGGAEGTRIQGNRIGTTTDGEEALANIWGVYVDGFVDSNGVTRKVTNALIGGTEQGAGNLISGSQNEGIVVYGPGSQGIVIQGNQIGTDVEGVEALGNGASGIHIEEASGVTIGGTDDRARNVISGNIGSGIAIVGGIAREFDEKAQFLAATGAVDATGPIPNIGAFTGEVSVGELTFSPAPGRLLHVGGPPLFDYYEPRPGSEIAISGVEDFNVDLNTLAQSFGFEFVEPDATMPSYGGDPVESTFTATMLRAGTVVDSFTFSRENDVVTFVGFASRHQFDRVEIRETTGSRDDEYFGRFYVGASPVGNTIQGNYIGTTADGMSTLANGGDGVHIDGCSGNLIGDAEPGANQLIGVIGSHVASLDTTTGDADETGASPNLSHVQGLTYHAGVGALFGISDAYAATDPKLVRVDTATGQTTVVGSIDIAGPSSVDVILAESMAYNPADGLLYAAVGDFKPFSNRLVTIDPATGQATQIGAITGTASNEADALEFVNGTLYAVDVRSESFLYTVDTATGQATLVGEIGFNSVADLAFDPETQTLYGMSPYSRELIVIDPATGHGSLVGATHTSTEFDGDVMTALAWTPSWTPSNVISGNAGNGVAIVGGAANTLQGNYIGTTADGMAKLGNGASGVLVTDSSGNLIGGDIEEARNVIASNQFNVRISGADAAGNLVLGNYVGVNKEGTAALDAPSGPRPNPNENGIQIDGGAHDNRVGEPGTGNLVSGHREAGVVIIGGAGNVVEGNMLGTDALGTQAIANLRGVQATDAPDTRVADNLISGNYGGILGEGAATTGLVIQGNLIGTDASGMQALPDLQYGILLSSVPGAQIGGETDAQRNVLAGGGNQGDRGIDIRGGSTSTVVWGNYIGTAADGVSPLSHFRGGILLAGDTNTQIGGTEPGQGNVIFSTGVAVTVGAPSALSSGGRIVGNRIGVHPDGMAAIGAGGYGVSVISQVEDLTIGGTEPDAGNVILGNSLGIVVTGPDVHGLAIQGNKIGTDIDGADALPNGTGVLLQDAAGVTIGGTDPQAGNLIAGNTANGISLNGGSANTIQNNVVSANGSYGVLLNASAGNQVLDNQIGTNPTGDAAMPNYIGLSIQDAGGNLVQGNTISGNSERGVYLSGSTSPGNQFVANHIGVGADGMTIVPNGTGVLISGAAENAFIGNVISSNSGAGVTIELAPATANVFEENLIGVAADGTTARGNNSHGVVISSGARGNRIGVVGLDPDLDLVGNTIAFNVGDGVRVTGADTSGNSIRGNSIYSNGGLGIDLAGDSVTENDHQDPDLGPHGLQNFAEIDSAVYNVGLGTTRIVVSLDSMADSDVTVDLYAVAAPDEPWMHGEGRRWLGAFRQSTNRSGGFSYSLDVAAVAEGEYITATTTDVFGNTSEFSPAVLVNTRGGGPNGGGPGNGGPGNGGGNPNALLSSALYSPSATSSSVETTNNDEVGPLTASASQVDPLIAATDQVFATLEDETNDVDFELDYLPDDDALVDGIIQAEFTIEPDLDVEFADLGVE